MSRTRASIVLVVVAAAFVALLVWLIGGADDPPGVPVTPPTHVPDATLPDAATKRTRASTPETASALATDVAAPDSSTSEPDGSPLFPRLVVEVRLADGTWPHAADGFVYALRPGESGARGPVAVESLRRGACTLSLPAPGVYDVGAVGGGDFVWTLATDVDSRTTDRVTLTMPEVGDVRFVVDAADEGSPGTFEVTADEGPPRSGTPGRGEVCSWSMGLEVSKLPTTLRARHDLTLTCRSVKWPSDFRPRRFKPPGVVTIGRPSWGEFRLRVGVEPADRVAGPNAFVSLEFAIEGGGEVRRWPDMQRLWWVDEGVLYSDEVRFTWRKSPPAAHSVLRWTGVGVLPGSIVIDVPDDGLVEVPVVLRLDESKPLPRAEFVVRVDGPADARDVKCWVVVPEGGAEGLHDVAALGRDQVISSRMDSTPYAVIAAAHGLVSAPAPLVTGGRHELVLRRTGCLRIVRGVRPPDAVELKLRRKDGLPLLAREDDQLDVVSHVDVRRSVDLQWPTVIVGPLPEGDVAFVVSYRTTDLLEFTARVVAGETTDVRLPLAEQLRAR